VSVYSKIERMNIARSISLRFSLIAASFLISACSVDKLEARLQADPQCKPVVNQKTGALMPCPGTDKDFYRSIPALSAVVPQPTQTTQTTQTPEVAMTSSSSQAVKTKITVAPNECKPQLHQNSGALMPCPAPLFFLSSLAA
jgi:hypothetical protein